MATTTNLDLSGLAVELGDLVSRLARLLAREGLPINRTRLSVLVRLRRGGPVRITDLAEGEHVAQPSMTALVARLEEDGWVERRSDPADGRVVNVAITSTGCAVLDEAVRVRAEALHARLERLFPEQRTAIAAAVAAIDALLDDERRQ